jgi:hypothetical protein
MTFFVAKADLSEDAKMLLSDAHDSRRTQKRLLLGRSLISFAARPCDISALVFAL